MRSIVGWISYRKESIVVRNLSDAQISSSLICGLIICVVHGVEIVFATLWVWWIIRVTIRLFGFAILEVVLFKLVLFNGLEHQLRKLVLLNFGVNELLIVDLSHCPFVLPDLLVEAGELLDKCKIFLIPSAIPYYCLPLLFFKHEIQFIYIFTF